MYNKPAFSDIEEQYSANASDIEDETLWKSLNIKVLIAGMVTEELTCTLSLTREEDIEGYDSGKLVKKALKKYELNPEFVDVDYYSNSLHTFIKVFD